MYVNISTLIIRVLYSKFLLLFFNPSTTLNVVVPIAGHVSVKIYYVVGQEVATLADGVMAENFTGYKLNWNASDLSSGVYFVRAESAGHVSFEKFMLLK